MGALQEFLRTFLRSFCFPGRAVGWRKAEEPWGCPAAWGEWGANPREVEFQPCGCRISLALTAGVRKSKYRTQRERRDQRWGWRTQCLVNSLRNKVPGKIFSSRDRGGGNAKIFTSRTSFSFFSLQQSRNPSEISALKVKLESFHPQTCKLFLKSVTLEIIH